MSTYAGSCYCVDASGSYSITQTNPSISMNTSSPLAYYDVSNAIQIRMGVRAFNELIGITKDEDNEEIIESLYDISNDELETDTLVFSTNNFNQYRTFKSGIILRDDIKNIDSKNSNKSIVFLQCGHVMSGNIINRLLDTDISVIDIGSSFDIMMKHEFIGKGQEVECWTGIDENQLVKHVEFIENNF
jgi:hypothetical protein